MSVWANIDGEIRISKKKKVSIGDVIEEHFGDEFSALIDIEDDGPDWYHRIHVSICVYGDHFIEVWPAFKRSLEATSMDLTCTIRMLK